MTNSECFLL